MAQVVARSGVLESSPEVLTGIHDVAQGIYEFRCQFVTISHSRSIDVSSVCIHLRRPARRSAISFCSATNDRAKPSRSGKSESSVTPATRDSSDLRPLLAAPGMTI